MKFIGIRELRNNTAKFRKNLKEAKEMIITASGQPFAIVIPVDPDGVAEGLQLLRRAKFHAVLDRLGKKAKDAGLDKLSVREIDEIIAETRREKRSKGKAS